MFVFFRIKVEVTETSLGDIGNVMAHFTCLTKELSFLVKTFFPVLQKMFNQRRKFQKVRYSLKCAITVISADADSLSYSAVRDFPCAPWPGG